MVKRNWDGYSARILQKSQTATNRGESNGYITQRASAKKSCCRKSNEAQKGSIPPRKTTEHELPKNTGWGGTGRCKKSAGRWEGGGRTNQTVTQVGVVKQFMDDFSTKNSDRSGEMTGKNYGKDKDSRRGRSEAIKRDR